MMPLARRLLHLASAGLVAGAICLVLLSTGEQREEAACAADPGWFCGLGQALLTSFAEHVVAPILLASLLLVGLAWRAAAWREEPGVRAALAVALPSALLAAGAWALSLRASSALRGCGADFACLEHGLSLGSHAEASAVVFLVAGGVAALESWRLPSRREATGADPATRPPNG